MAIKVRVEKNIFKALARQLDPRARQIVAETKEDIVASARLLVPYVTGNLYRSIRVTPTGVGAFADYAAIIEYGAPPGRRPQPYLTPAAEYHRRVMLLRLRDDLFRERMPARPSPPSKAQLRSFHEPPGDETL